MKAQQLAVQLREKNYMRMLQLMFRSIEGLDTDAREQRESENKYSKLVQCGGS
jgi:hypothetical protein